MIFTIIFLIFSCIYLIISLWLNKLQKKSVAQNFHTVPLEFSSQITLKKHQKAAKYTISKLKLSNFELVLSIIILFIFTIGGGIQLINDILKDVFTNKLLLGSSVIIFTMVIGSLLEIPVSIYKTFFLEEKFGFNNIDKKTFILDIVKNFIISLIIGIPILMAILWAMEIGGEFWWFFVWLIISSFSLFMFWAYPSFIAPIFNKFEALKNKELTEKIEGLLKKTGFKSNGLFVMDGSKRSSHGNAYFSGFGKNKRIVFFDTLLKGLTDDEVLAVLAHELGHFKKKHIIKHIFTSFLSMLVMLAILGFLIKQPWFFYDLGVNDINNHNALILFVFILPIFTFFLNPLTNILSRKFEFEADNFAKEYTNGNDLISALIKMYRDNASTLTPNRTYSNFYDSHPPASIRIKHIRNE